MWHNTSYDGCINFYLCLTKILVLIRLLRTAASLFLNWITLSNQPFLSFHQRSRSKVLPFPFLLLSHVGVRNIVLYHSPNQCSQYKKKFGKNVSICILKFCTFKLHSKYSNAILHNSNDSASTSLRTVNIEWLLLISLEGWISRCTSGSWPQTIPMYAIVCLQWGRHVF